jgi:DUF4097 and DUF4098 domain-containing protein YvlB
MWVLVFGVTIPLAAQTHTEKITKEFSFEKMGAQNALIIANVNGNIKVESYAGDKIQVEVTKSIHAKTQERLDKGKTEIQLGVIDLADTIVLYVDGLCSDFGKNNNQNSRSGKHSNSERRWTYSGTNNCLNCHESYEYKMDFAVKVPASLNLMVSTINNGDIVVANVRGIISANNINGSILLQHLTREAEATTINGDVDIEYAQNPQRDCRFYSLNGDINASFQKGLAASMSFESFNGSFYTNIDQLETLPALVEKHDENKGVKYKVNNNRYKIRTGGAFLDFETFNGNVYLKEKLN